MVEVWTAEWLEQDVGAGRTHPLTVMCSRASPEGSRQRRLMIVKAMGLPEIIESQLFNEVFRNLLAQELDFEHAFKNERWHVLQPVSLDYARPESLQEKAMRCLGQASVLEGNPELGRLYLLLGAPLQPSHREAYEKAKRLLHKMPVEHEVVEEDQAEEFARRIAECVREHGVVTTETIA